MDHYTLDADDNPVFEPDFVRWAEWDMRSCKHIDFMRVGRVTVSTVFLGVAHRLLGPPLLFETMVFGGVHNEAQVRYPTARLAELGHREMVKLVLRAGVPIR